MADILIQSAVPSLFTQTESASNLIVESPTADSNNNTTIHHTRTSINNNNSNSSYNSNTTNKYIGHVSRLRNVFTQYALTLNDFKPGEHRSRYSNHQQDVVLSPNDTNENVLSIPTSSGIIERSRSLSNSRLLDNNTSTMKSIRNGISSLTMNENSLTKTNVNEDHTVRFRKAKEMFQTLEEEAAARTTVSLITTKQNKLNDFDLMHNDQQIISSEINTEHIPDLIIDHRQQQIENSNDSNLNRLRNIPVQFISTSLSTQSDRSFTSIPIHRTVPSLITNDDTYYAMINRKSLNSDQHYDFPADAIEQLKQQHNENDSIKKLSNVEVTNRTVTSILPSNILKRMDHLNTIFIKPTNIDYSLPRLSFQDNEQQQISTNNEDVENQSKWIDNPMLTNGKYNFN